MAERRRSVARAATMALVVVAACAAAPAEAATTVPVPVVAQADDGLPEPVVDPDEARERADEILARPEFQPEREGLIQRAISWIGERVLGAIERGVGTGGDLVGWLLLVGLLALVAWLVRRVQPTARRSPTARAAPVAVVEDELTAEQWRALAAEHEAAGDWVEALRCRYRALVGDLVDRAVVRDVPGRTVGEHREALRASLPAAQPPFDRAAAVYEEAWYGHGGAGPDEAAAFRHAADEVLAEVPR